VKHAAVDRFAAAEEFENYAAIARPRIPCGERESTDPQLAVFWLAAPSRMLR
jgi:hypothetical protein